VPPVAIAALAVIAALATLGVVGALGHPVLVWDGWSIYLRKALSLFDAGRLDGAFFEDPRLAFMQADYPLLLPLMEAIEMKFGAAGDGTGLLVIPWLLFVAYAWTVVFVAVRVIRSAWPLAVGVALIVAPGGYQQALSGYADVPMAALLGAGVLFVGCWARTGHRGFLAAGAVLLAGAGSTKNEGLLGALVVLLGAFAVARPPLRRRDALLALVAVAVALLPWRLWLGRHGIRGDVAFGNGLSPSYLAHHTGRAWLAVRRLGHDAFGPDWPLIMPAALVTAAVAVLSRQGRRLALFHLGVGAGFFVALVWVYWISQNEIGWYLTSAPRTVTGLVLIGSSAIVQLAGGRPETRSCPGH
jgi:hypothetical protein